MSGERPLHESIDGQTFAAAAAAVARGDDLDDSLAELLGLAAERLGASHGAMYIIDRDHDELDLAVTHGVDAATAKKAGSIKRVSLSRDPLAGVARSRHPLEIDDAAHVEVLRGAATALLLPLVVRRDDTELTLGVMALGFTKPRPSREAKLSRRGARRPRGGCHRACADALARLGAGGVVRSARPNRSAHGPGQPPDDGSDARAGSGPSGAPGIAAEHRPDRGRSLRRDPEGGRQSGRGRCSAASGSDPRRNRSG